MSAEALLDDLRQRGVALAARGDRLSVDAPRGALTDQVRAAIAARKADLLTLLEAEAARAEWERLDAAMSEMNQRLFELWEEGERDAAKALQDELRRLVGEAWQPARVRLARLEHELGRLSPADAWLLGAEDDSAGPRGTTRAPRRPSEPLLVDAIERPSRPCFSCHSDACRERTPERSGGWVCDACHPDSERLDREWAEGRSRAAHGVPPLQSEGAL